jgi:hypothetical protein
VLRAPVWRATARITVRRTSASMRAAIIAASPPPSCDAPKDSWRRRMCCTPRETAPSSSGTPFRGCRQDPERRGAGGSAKSGTFSVSRRAQCKITLRTSMTRSAFIAVPAPPSSSPSKLCSTRVRLLCSVPAARQTSRAQEIRHPSIAEQRFRAPQAGDRLMSADFFGVAVSCVCSRACQGTGLRCGGRQGRRSHDHLRRLVRDDNVMNPVSFENEGYISSASAKLMETSEQLTMEPIEGAVFITSQGITSAPEGRV